jgi:hypothetical protein
VRRLCGHKISIAFRITGRQNSSQNTKRTSIVKLETGNPFKSTRTDCGSFPKSVPFTTSKPPSTGKLAGDVAVITGARNENAVAENEDCDSTDTCTTREPRTDHTRHMDAQGPRATIRSHEPSNASWFQYQVEYDTPTARAESSCHSLELRTSRTVQSSRRHGERRDQSLCR